MSDPAGLTCADNYGDTVVIDREGDDVLVTFESPSMRFDAQRFAAFREQLDRAAMPGVTSGG